MLDADCRTLLGGILVGDARAYGELRPYVGLGLPAAGHRLLAGAA